MQPTHHPDPETHVLSKALLQLSAVSSSLSDIQRIIRELFDDVMVAGGKIGEGGVDFLTVWDQSIIRLGEYGDFSEELLDEAYDYSCTTEFEYFLAGTRAGEYFDTYRSATQDLENLKTNMSLVQHMRCFEYIAQTVTFLMRKFRTDQGKLSCGIAGGDLVNRGKSQRGKYLHGLVSRIIHELSRGLALIPTILNHPGSGMLTNETRVQYINFENSYKQELEYFWGIYPTNRVLPFSGETQKQEVKMLQKKIITYEDNRCMLLQSFFLSQTAEQRSNIILQIQQCEKNLHQARSELAEYCKNHRIVYPLSSFTEEDVESTTQRAMNWEISHRQDDALEDFAPSETEMKILPLLGKDFEQKEYALFHFTFTERSIADGFEEKVLKEDLKTLRGRQCERKMLLYFRACKILGDVKNGTASLPGALLQSIQESLSCLGDEIEPLLASLRLGGNSTYQRSPDNDANDTPLLYNHVVNELGDAVSTLDNLYDKISEGSAGQLIDFIGEILCNFHQIIEYIRIITYDPMLTIDEKNRFIAEYIQDMASYCGSIEVLMDQKDFADMPAIDDVYKLIMRIQGICLN